MLWSSLAGMAGLLPQAKLGGVGNERALVAVRLPAALLRRAAGTECHERTHLLNMLKVFENRFEKYQAFPKTATYPSTALSKPSAPFDRAVERKRCTIFGTKNI